MSNHSPALTLKEFNELTKTNKLIIVDFWATWCPPCKFMTPIFEELAKDEEMSKLEFYQTDVDANNDLASMFRITSIPTFTIIKFDGSGKYDPETHLIGKLVGGMDGLTFKQKILEYVEKIEVGTEE